MSNSDPAEATEQLLSLLANVRDVAATHNGDQPARVLLHTLTVEIPEMIDAALARPPKPDRATESERDRLVRERDAAREISDYGHTYDTFWKELVETNGKLDPDKVKRELHDYHTMLDQVPKVYSHVTEGRLSKPNTAAAAVITEHDDVVTKLCEEAAAEAVALAQSGGGGG